MKIGFGDSVSKNIYLFSVMAGRQTRQNHSIQHLLEMTPSTSKVTRKTDIDMPVPVEQTPMKLTATPKKVSLI